MNLDDAKRKALGLKGGGLVDGKSVMNYVTGVVTRERERLARAFEKHGLADVAAAVRDESLDDNVFKWVGPGGDLDSPPKSVEGDESA